MPAELLVTQLDGEEKGFVYVATDMSERLANEREQRLAATVLANTREGVVVTDGAGTIIQANPAFCLITGLVGNDVIGRSLFALEAQTADGSNLDTVFAAVLNEGRWDGEIWYRHATGLNPVWLNITTIYDSQGRIEHYAAVFTDLRALKDAERRIHHLAYFDSLTNLPNRVLFQDRLHQLLTQAQRHGELVALLSLDLDRFKVINDTKGHATGDRLLISVAQRLHGIVREEDSISRLGGDEFAILVPGLHSGEQAALMAQKVLDAFAVPFQLDGENFYTGASIGVSLYPVDAASPETLLANADAAMFRAKETGPNTYRFFTSDMNDRVTETMEIESGLRQAIDRNELMLHYQPQYDLRDGRLVGIEALLRWNSPRLGDVPPSLFIPVAEDCGLIGLMGEWVLREACRQVKAWQARGFDPVRVAVNLSARQFADPRLLAQIEGALTDSGLDAKRLELEITETAMMVDVDRSAAVLTKLDDLGVNIAVDDFGTGYSSLSYLKRFPFHALKIDRTFIRHVLDDPDDASIASAIITMAHSLGMTVVAEGAESAEHERFLQRHDCDMVQGYYYSHPLPATAIEDLLPRATGVSLH